MAYSRISKESLEPRTNDQTNKDHITKDKLLSTIHEQINALGPDKIDLSNFSQIQSRQEIENDFIHEFNYRCDWLEPKDHAFLKLVSDNLQYLQHNENAYLSPNLCRKIAEKAIQKNAHEVSYTLTQYAIQHFNTGHDRIFVEQLCRDMTRQSLKRRVDISLLLLQDASNHNISIDDTTKKLFLEEIAIQKKNLSYFSCFVALNERNNPNTTNKLFNETISESIKKACTEYSKTSAPIDPKVISESLGIARLMILHLTSDRYATENKDENVKPTIANLTIDHEHYEQFIDLGLKNPQVTSPATLKNVMHYIFWHTLPLEDLSTRTQEEPMVKTKLIKLFNTCIKAYGQFQDNESAYSFFEKALDLNCFNGQTFTEAMRSQAKDHKKLKKLYKQGLKYENEENIQLPLDIRFFNQAIRTISTTKNQYEYNDEGQRSKIQKSIDSTQDSPSVMTFVDDVFKTIIEREELTTKKVESGKLTKKKLELEKEKLKREKFNTTTFVYAMRAALRHQRPDLASSYFEKAKDKNFLNPEIFKLSINAIYESDKDQQTKINAINQNCEDAANPRYNYADSALISTALNKLGLLSYDAAKAVYGNAMEKQHYQRSGCIHLAMATIHINYADADKDQNAQKNADELLNKIKITGKQKKCILSSNDVSLALNTVQMMSNEKKIKAADEIFKVAEQRQKINAAVLNQYLDRNIELLLDEEARFKMLHKLKPALDEETFKKEMQIKINRFLTKHDATFKEYQPVFNNFGTLEKHIKKKYSTQTTEQHQPIKNQELRFVMDLHNASIGSAIFMLNNAMNNYRDYIEQIEKEHAQKKKAGGMPPPRPRVIIVTGNASGSSKSYDGLSPTQEAVRIFEEYLMDINCCSLKEHQNNPGSYTLSMVAAPIRMVMQQQRKQYTVLPPQSNLNPEAIAFHPKSETTGRSASQSSLGYISEGSQTSLNQLLPSGQLPHSSQSFLGSPLRYVSEESQYALNQQPLDQSPFSQGSVGYGSMGSQSSLDRLSHSSQSPLNSALNQSNDFFYQPLSAQTSTSTGSISSPWLLLNPYYLIHNLRLLRQAQETQRKQQLQLAYIAATEQQQTPQPSSSTTHSLFPHPQSGGHRNLNPAATPPTTMSQVYKMTQQQQAQQSSSVQSAHSFFGRNPRPAAPTTTTMSQVYMARAATVTHSGQSVTSNPNPSPNQSREEENQKKERREGKKLPAPNR